MTRPGTTRIVTISMDEATLAQLDAMAGHRGRSSLVAGLVRTAHAAVAQFHEHQKPLRRKGAAPLPFDLTEPNAPVLSIRAMYHPREPQPMMALPERTTRRKAPTPRKKAA